MTTPANHSWQTVSRGALRGALACALALLILPAPAVLGRAAAPAPQAGAGPRLQTISTRTESGTLVVLLELSEPVAYATTQPDPLTVLVDLRNVSAAGAVNQVAAGASHPVSTVTVEEMIDADRVATARIRVRLAEAASYRVRSVRNVIRVEIDRPAAGGARPQPTSGVSAPPLPAPAAKPVAKPADSSAALARASQVKPPAPATRKVAATTSATRPTVLSSVRLLQSPDGPAVVLGADGALVARAPGLAGGPPPRLVLDFPGVSSAVPPMTPGGQGPIERVRVALNSAEPLVTRVVIDLSTPARFELKPNGNDLTIVFPQASEAAAPKASPSGAPAAPGGATTRRAPATPKTEAPKTEAPKPEPPKQQTAKADGAKVEPSKAETPAPPAPVSPAPGATASPSLVVASSAAAAVQPPAETPQAVPAATPVQQPPAAPPSILGLQQRGEKQYTGHPISMDFAGSDLRSVLRMFSEISGLNILIDDAVKGTVDMSLRDVPWDQAFEVILRSKQLGWILEGNVVRIVPLSVLADEEKQRRTLAEEQSLGGELGVITHTLSYAKAEEMKTLLEKVALTKRGEVQVFASTNTLIVRDLPVGLQAAEELMKTLDRPQPQVEIEARIVQTTRTFARQLGAQLGFLGRATPELGNTLPLSFPNSATLAGRTGATQGPGATPSAVNMGVTGATSAVGLTLGAINGAFNIDVALTAIETSGQGRLLSTPRVFAQNNVAAEITQGVQIPIQTIANNTITVTFKDAALSLKVTPQINADNTVILSITLENAAPDYTKSVNNIPPIDTQRAVTQVMVRDGQTAVLGGIYVSNEQAQNEKTPGLGQIPILGWLFRRNTVDEQTRELLIFITPKIVKS
jgi:type IV pilus secretin PilQ/predicted competence protein